MENINQLLINIVERVIFIFDHKPNYPKGSVEYKLAQDAKAALKQAKK